MAKYNLGKAAFDSTGKAVFTAPVKPGRYFILGSGRTEKGGLVWDVPLELKAGDNALALSPANAEAVP